VLEALRSPWPEDAVVVVDLPGPAAEELVWDPGVHAVVAHASNATCKRQLAGLGAAYAAGARLRPYIPEGSGNDERGAHFTPTIVRLPPGALGVALWREESFAPLRGLVLADGPEHALALANDTPYALGATVFGPGEEVVAGLRAARVLVDEGPLYQDPHLVVGGVGDSGLAGARPKLEQLVWARRVHRAAGG
jgi:acyl-CoA reductase-like NAD-dependent aldehyde dehydrogenase